MDENSNSLARKTYNFICGSGGILSVSQLVKKPSPLERLQTEEEVRKWLRNQTQKDRRFVLIMGQDGKITGLRIDLRKKICSQYWLRGSCYPSKGKCKYWHICKNYIEGTCEGSCSRSHDFHDDVNEWKVKELELERFDNGAIRNIVAESLPQVCLSYVRWECFSGNCPYLHINSSVEARGESSFSCASTSQLTDDHNKAILKQFDLVPHRCMKVEFVQCNILVPCRQQERFEATHCSSTGSEGEEGTFASTRNNENTNKTCSPNQDLLEMLTLVERSESQEMHTLQLATALPSQDLPTCSRQEETISFSKRKPRGRKKATKQHKIKDERKKSEQFVGCGEELVTPVCEGNNLGMIGSWKCSQMIPDFLNIQEEGVASVNGSKTINTKEQISNLGSSKDIKMPRNSGLKGQVVSATPSNNPLSENAACSNTIASLDEMSSQNGTVTSNADGVRTLVMNDSTQTSCNLPHSRFENDPPERIRKLSVSSSCSSTMERTNENLPSKKAVFECICKEYSCSVSFAVISERSDLFPEGCGNVASWFRGKRDCFMLGENEDGTINEVTAICRRARLCFGYTSYKKCSKDSCQHLHVCRAYAAGYCRFGYRCSMEHSFQNEKDRKLISKLKLDGLSDEELRKVVQNSSPQVCLEYNGGLCPEGDKCPRIHICKNFIRRKCDPEDACCLGHEAALQTSRTRKILKKYAINQELPVGTILRMLLLSDATPLGKTAVTTSNTESGSPLQRTTTPTKVVGVDHEDRGWFMATRDQDNNPEPVPVPVPRFSSNTLSAVNSEPSESKVFESLCKDYNCSVQFSVIANRKDLFPEECKDIEFWFRKWKSSFLITESSNGAISSIDAFSARARLCLSYINFGTCVKSNCVYFHMCRDYVTDNCSYGATCTKNHSFHNERDKTFLANVKLDRFTNEQLRKLVLSSAPQVCLDYNIGSCERGVSCTRIHVCKDFLRKTCKNGYLCDLDHESAMATDHARAVLERYHFSKVGSSEGQMDALQKQILCCDGQDWSGKNNGHVHKNKPTTPICCDFLLGKCKKGQRCSGHHCSRPFHWQYKVPRSDEWKSFSEKDNDTLEKSFCDPSQDEIRIKGLRMCLDSTGISTVEEERQADVYLEDRLMVLSDGLITQIRRLSTESCVTNPNNSLATNWIWRWEDEHGIWREYDYDCYGRDLQKLIEAAFLNPQGPIFTFSMPEHDYQVYFHSTSMFQQNVKYQTKRNVRRRPLIAVTNEDLRQLKSQNRGAVSYAQKQQSQSGTLPSHWSPMSPNDQFIRVKLASSSSEFQKVLTSFTKTIGEYVRIVSIERVQNPFMWEKFRRKRDNMAAVKTRNRERKSVNEKQLFHGTSPEAVTAICKQNFDWRLHGKNATVYGEGSYFAANASYSHNYTKADTDSCRYMFLADVLVGSYTKGDRSFRRPPPIQPWNPESDLFDSCVDNEYHPTIFVVFDTDQFYPAYVIKYSLTSFSAPVVPRFVPLSSRPAPAHAQSYPVFSAPPANPASTRNRKDKCWIM